MIVSGDPVEKELKNCFSEMMNQLGPKQLEAVKNIALPTTAGRKAEAPKEAQAAPAQAESKPEAPKAPAEEHKDAPAEQKK